MDVAVWLQSLGLGQYEASFRENSIDEDVLPDLTDTDLAQLGVNLGDRKRLLKAIASLGSQEPGKLSAKPSRHPTRDEAERRPITVLFCDLVGSTNLVAKLDAEDWRNLVGQYLDTASAAVTAFGGRVQERLGDGLMVLFGYPHALENDAERAVRAALAIQQALGELNVCNAKKEDPQLRARIGVDSGQVVVDTTGAVFGEAPNVASRVQSLAEPGTVVVTSAVQRQIAGLFIAEDRGLHELKGMPAPAVLYRIVRASGGGRRHLAGVLTPFIGREDELGLLSRRWDSAQSDQGQFVLITGEPGIGKSRLLQEFLIRLGETPHTWVEWSSSQLLQNTPLHPIVEWGRLRFGGANTSDERRAADLEQTMQLLGLSEGDYAPLASLLLEVTSGEDLPTEIRPDELRRRQLAAIEAWILSGARSQPIVLAFEDLQWADPTSLDLMRALAERGAEASLLIIATARPEFRPPWTANSHHSVITLSPLAHTEVTRMVGQIASRYALSEDVIEGVSERSGGVPLFVEEVTRLLLERGGADGSPMIPPTLQQSLAARLDRLGPAREIAQIGAVLGRRFSHALLQDVADLDDAELRSALDQLVDAGLLFTEGEGAKAGYRFKHALIQDAAYESLLRSRRRALHSRAAELLSGSPERATAEPEAIARHYTDAGVDHLAIEWWGRAGDQALRRSAFQEAIAHLGKAIAMVDQAEAAARRGKGASALANHRLTELHVAYANALIAARGYAAPETTEAFARARASASDEKDTIEQLASAYGLWLGGYVRGELSLMKAHAQPFLNAIATRPDLPEAAVAHRIAGINCWFVGDYREGQDHFERALAAFRPGRDDDLAFRFGFDPGVGAMGYLASALWSLGEVDRAISLIDGMTKRAKELTHVGTLAFATLHTALFELMRGDPSRVAPYASELTRLAREHKLAFHGAAAAFLEGWVKAHDGGVGGLEEMRLAFEAVRQQKVLSFLDLGSIALAKAEARAGDGARAVVLVEEALATGEHAGNHAFEAELRRARGEMLLLRDSNDVAAAEDAFRTAIAVAHQQGARSFELRGALSLAKLLCAMERHAEAHAILAPALGRLTPTAAFPEIEEASSLVARVESRGES